MILGMKSLSLHDKRFVYMMHRSIRYRYDSRYDVLTYLEKDISAGFSDIIAKYNSRKDKAKSVRDRLYKLTQETLSREKSELGTALASGTAVRHKI